MDLSVPRFPEPGIYRLRIRRIECSNLRKVDMTGNDPYVRLDFGGDAMIRTKYRRKAGSSAEWNVSMDIEELDTSSDMSMKAEVWDHNDFASKAKIGEISIPIRDLLAPVLSNLGNEVVRELSLQNAGKPSGEMKLFLTAFRNETDVHADLKRAREKIDTMIGILTDLTEKLSFDTINGTVSLTKEC